MGELGLPNLSVQINQNCNFACGHCGFQSNFRKTRNNRPMYMSLQFFMDIIDQYRRLKQQEQKSLSLVAGGEPLLHPRFLELCEYANQSDISFGFDTNASLLTHDISHRLLSLKNFKRIVFSIDSLSPETYSAIRIGGSLEEVHQNVFGFLKMAKKLIRKDVHSRVNIVQQPDNEHEIDDFVRYWTPYVSQVNVIKLRHGTRVDAPHWQPDKRLPCRFLYNHMRILTDGSVVVCCLDDNFESVIGNITDSSIADVWRGPAYEALRERQEDSDFNTPAICRDCNCWSGFLAPREYRILHPNIILGERPISITANMLERHEDNRG